jgi:hypothetical protein
MDKLTREAIRVNGEITTMNNAGLKWKKKMGFARSLVHLLSVLRLLAAIPI